MHRPFSQGAWTAVLALMAALILLSSVANGQATTDTPVPTESGTAPVATGTGTGTGPAPTGPVPTNTNGGNQTIPTPTGPRPTRPAGAPLATLSVLAPPNRKDNPPIYAFGTNIEFAWVIDTKNLLLQPANITLDAIPQAPENKNKILTIAVLPPGTTNFTWTPALQQNNTNALREDMYSLRIYDGQVGPYGFLTDGGGYLQSFAGLRFGLYTPGKYNTARCNCDSPDPTERCGTCEFSSVGNSAHKSLSPASSVWGFSIATILVVVVSFAL